MSAESPLIRGLHGFRMFGILTLLVLMVGTG